MKKQIGYIGLGKMGSAMVERLEQKKWRVATYDVAGNGSAKSIEQLITGLEKPRLIWLMVPAGDPVDEVLFGDQGLVVFLEEGDIVIDGGNSFFENSVMRAEKLERIGVHYLDVGVSGGPETVREGKPALMIGGDENVYKEIKPLFEDLTGKDSFEHVGKSGAGHFVKMVHNGIEYGVMQSLAEGFTLMEKSSFDLNLEKVARVYSNGSVIESRLTKWLQDGLAKYGQDLEKASGKVAHTGEGEWTVKTAEKMGIYVPAIKAAFEFRKKSAKNPNYTGKILSLLRHMFGGHSLK